MSQILRRRGQSTVDSPDAPFQPPISRQAEEIGELKPARAEV